MRDIHWRRLDPLAEIAAEETSRFLGSPEIDKLKAAIQAAAKDLPADYVISFDIGLNVFDPERGQSLPLTNTALCSSGPGEPYVGEGQCTPQRYLVDGEICEVPHDRCPHCWGDWDFKAPSLDDAPAMTSCRECGYELGKQVQLLLDSDLCPHCEERTISQEKPRCDNCGLNIDPRLVAWG